MLEKAFNVFLMTITLVKTLPSSLPLVIGFFEGEKSWQLSAEKSFQDTISLHLKEKTFAAKSGEHLLTHVMDQGHLVPTLLFGFGKKEVLTEIQARVLGAQCLKSCKSFKKKEFAVVLPKEIGKVLQNFVEGMVLANFDPATFKTGEEKKKKEEAEITSIHLVGAAWGANHEEQLEKAIAVASAVNEVRTLVNTPPDQLDIQGFVNEAKKIAHEQGLAFTDFDRKKLEKMSMGGILAVNRGSSQGAHMVILEHLPNRNEPPIVLVGKGIIFDTGGISLKPSGSLHEMHIDMAGGAVVLGVIKLLKMLKIKKNVVAIVPITDNAIGSKSYRPSEIVKSYSGKTIEVLNTDAEGRMILCDALWYAATKYKPKYVIDLATLTGSCIVALGYRTAGLFGNDEKLLETIKDSAKRTDEAVCELPITDADEKSMKGRVADLQNMATGHVYAGPSRGAAFLKNFINGSKWAHIDIAGTAYTKDPKDYEINSATGFGVRLLVDFFERLG